MLSTICNFFSPRELASMVLLGLYLLCSMHSRSVRRSMIQFIKCLFSLKLFISVILLYIWIVVVACLVIYILKCWNIAYIKEVVVFAFSVIPFMIRISKYSSYEDFLNLIIGQIKCATIISVYLNLYSLSFWWEIILQTLISVIILMRYEIERQQNMYDKVVHQLYGCLNKCSVLLCGIILSFLLYQTCIHPIMDSIRMLILGVAMPFFLILVATPYFYIYRVYMVYEGWFVRLKRSVGNDDVEYLIRKRSLLKYCKLNLNKIKYFEQRIKLFLLKDRKDFISQLLKCENEYGDID